MAVTVEIIASIIAVIAIIWAVASYWPQSEPEIAAPVEDPLAWKKEELVKPIQMIELTSAETEIRTQAVQQSVTMVELTPEQLEAKMSSLEIF